MNPYAPTSQFEVGNPYLPIPEHVEAVTINRDDPIANHQKVMASFMKAEASGENMFVTASENIHSDPEAAISSALQTSVNSQYQALENHKDRSLEAPVADELKQLPYIADAKNSIDQIYTRDNFEALAVQDLDMSNNEFMLATMQMNDYVLSLAKKVYDDAGKLEVAVDLAEGFVPFAASKLWEGKDVATAILGDEVGFLDVKEALGFVHNIWTNASPSQKKIIAPWMVKTIHGATDNTLLTNEFVKLLTLPKEELNKAVNLDALIDGLDAVSIVGSIWSTIKGVNAIRRLKDLGRDDDAVKATAILSDAPEDVQKLAGVTESEVAATKLPFDHEKMFVGMVDGVAHKVKHFEEKLKGAIQLQREDMSVADNAILQDRLANLDRNPDVSNVSLKGNTINFTVTRAGAKPVDYVVPMNRVDGFLELNTDGIGRLTANIAAPATKFIDDFKTMLGMATTTNQLARKSIKQYQKVLEGFQKDFKKLGKEQQKRLNATLMKGDEAGAVYNHSQLARAGLDDKAKAAYYEARILNDYAWHLKSKQLLDKLEFEGYVHYVPVTSSYGGFGRTIENPKSAFAQSGVSTYWDDVNGVSRPVTDLNQNMMDGNMVVRFRTPVNVGEEFFSYALVRKDGVRKGVQKDILPYRPGYVTNIHEKAKYFVVKPTPGTVNGVIEGNAYYSVDQAFSTKKKLNEYIAAQPGGKLPEGWDWRFDRDYDLVTKQEELRRYNGLFTGKRSETGLVIDGEPNTDLANPFDAIAAYYQDIASRGTLDKYRVELRQRWLNTWAKHIPVEFKDNFVNGMRNLQVAPGTREYRQAQEQWEHIRAATGLKSTDELSAENWLRQLSEKWEPINKAYLQGTETNSLTNRMKALSFQLNMGMLNFAQMIVQGGAGMALTMGAHPISFAKMMPKVMQGFVHSMHMLPTPKGRVHDLWLASGFDQSVDFLADMGRNLQTSKAWEISTYFLNKGELLNRRAAFYTAYDLMRTRKGREITKADLPELIGETHRLTLNFTQVNMAKWQHGVLGLVTQFQSIMEKSLNQIYNPFVKSPLTLGERSRIATTQALLFGLAGVPFGEWAWKKFDETAADSGMTPEQAHAWKTGFMGALPTETNFDRLATGNVINNFYGRLFTGDLPLHGTFKENLSKGMIGPFGATVARALDSFQDARKAWNVIDEQPELFLREMVEAAVLMPSSLRNAYLWYQYHQTEVVWSGTGRQMTARQLNALDQAFLSLGFQPQVIKEAFNAQEFKTAHDRYLKEAVDYSVEAWRKGVDVIDPASWSEGGIMAKMLGTTDPAIVSIIQERVEKRLSNEKTYLERVGERTGPNLWTKGTTNPVINEVRQGGTVR